MNEQEIVSLYRAAFSIYRHADMNLISSLVNYIHKFDDFTPHIVYLDDPSFLKSGTYYQICPGVRVTFDMIAGRLFGGYCRIVATKDYDYRLTKLQYETFNKRPPKF